MRAYLDRDFDTGPIVDDHTPEAPDEFTFLVTLGGGLRPGDGKLTLPTNCNLGGDPIRSAVFDSYDSANEFVEGIDDRWSPRIWKMWTGRPLNGGQR